MKKELNYMDSVHRYGRIWGIIVAIAVSSIVTTLIILVGVICIVPLTPVLESPILVPAFDMILPALNASTVGIMVPVGVIFTVIVARILYKKGVL